VRSAAFAIAMIFIGLLALPSSLSQELAHGIDQASDLDEIYNMSLEELLEVDIQTGRPGWFGTQLGQLKVKPYIHGYGVFDYRDYDLNRRKEVETFDMHYFNVLVGANVEDRIAAEVLLEYEHGGDDTGVRYGLLDYKLYDWLMIRMGKFLVPMGRFNEYLSPEYANKLPDRPYCLWRIVPIVWAETGLQLRGQYRPKGLPTLNYAVYVVNGLEQASGDGGDIRDMRGNNRDTHNNNKAIGGRIGFKTDWGLEGGFSYYRGAYTIDGDEYLSIMDLDAEYARYKWTFRGEYVSAVQEAVAGDLHKHGFYAEAAYRIDRHLEPVVRYDQAYMDDGSGNILKRTTFGLVFYPYPTLHPLFNFRVSQSIVHNDGRGDQTHEFVIQCVLGF